MCVCVCVCVCVCEYMRVQSVYLFVYAQMRHESGGGLIFFPAANSTFKDLII